MTHLFTCLYKTSGFALIFDTFLTNDHSLQCSILNKIISLVVLCILFFTLVCFERLNIQMYDSISYKWTIPNPINNVTLTHSLQQPDPETIHNLQ